MDWAIERSLPINLYLELEDHPDNKTQRTIKELKQKNRKREKLRERELYKLGIKDHTKRLNKRDKRGELL